MVCEDEAIRRQSRLDEVMKVGPWSNGIGVLTNEGEAPKLSPASLCISTEESPCENNRKVARK